MPIVSVVVPVFNASGFLRTCLDSILAQTLRDIEVICVDDGSSDGSRDLLHEYAARDARVTVLSQPNSGAGAARNLGMDTATGTYLSFLDADDFFEPKMFEAVSARCDACEADVGVFQARYYDTATGECAPARMVRVDLLPETMPFSRRDIPGDILTFTPAAPWNKLYRHSFVRKKGLRFQELRRANDLLFTKLAMAEADRIVHVDEVLVNYRIGHASSLQAANDETPFEFIEALVALRSELAERGMLAEIERSFVNTALLNCLYNLRSLRTPEAFCALYDALRGEWFTRLGIEGRSEDYFASHGEYVRYRMVTSLSPDTYLAEEIETLRDRLRRVQGRTEDMRGRLEDTRRAIGRIRRSRSFRLGEAIWPRRTAAPRQPSPCRQGVHAIPVEKAPMGARADAFERITALLDEFHMLRTQVEEANTGLDTMRSALDESRAELEAVARSPFHRTARFLRSPLSSIRRSRSKK